MGKKLNIEQLFSSKLEGMEQAPSPTVWKNTARVVRRKQFFRFHAGRFNVYYAAGILLAGAALTYIIATGGPSGADSTSDPGRDTQQNETTLPEASQAESPAMEAPGPEKHASNETARPGTSTSRSTLQTEGTGTQDKSNSEAGSGVTIQDTQPEQGAAVPEPIAPVTKQTNTPPATVTTLVPYFTPSVYEGCAPLTVEFINSSINASAVSWDFGMAASGYDQDTHGPDQDTQGYDQDTPGYNPDAPDDDPDAAEYDTDASGNDQDMPRVTYTAPGTYTIILKAINQEGLEKSYSETITVHPRPDAAFEIDRGAVYNYSVDASAFSWYVLPEDQVTGENQARPFSSEFQPSLEKAIDIGKSNYNNTPYLQLVAGNTFGCTDTVSAPLPEGSRPELVFPTAFSPNPNGSIGGYYNPSDPDNLVFHPQFNEVPEAYHLRIFNKAGTLVFETNDIYIGWDGYYQEAPAPAGVYIYQCTGTWKNGNPFQYQGDITILWNDQ